MRRHLKEVVLLDLVLDEAAPEARRHAANCPSCARRVADASETLSRVRNVVVPEPEAAFWSDFRRDVRLRVAGSPPAFAWRRWLVPAAAMAAAVTFAVGVPSPHTRRALQPSAAPTLGAWSPLPAVEDDAGLAVIEGLVQDQGAVAWEEGRGLAPLLAGLTDEESATLARALHQAGRGGAL